MTTKNILQRLNAVMNEPGADYIQKSQKRINGQYTAVTHDAVAKKLQPLFAKHGIVVTPSVMPESVRMLDTGRKTKAGNPIMRFEAIFEVVFRSVDEPMDTLTIKLPSHAEDEGDKAPGKAISYATKYALLKALMIESGDEEEERVEDGDTNTISGGEVQSEVGKVPAEQMESLLKTISIADSKELLTKALVDARNAAKAVNDGDAKAAFDKAAIKRAAELDGPAPQESAPAKPEAASAPIIKTLRKSMASKKADDTKVLFAIAEAGKGEFTTLDAISNEAAIWVMNEYLKKLEPVSA